MCQLLKLQRLSPEDKTLSGRFSFPNEINATSLIHLYHPLYKDAKNKHRPKVVLTNLIKLENGKEY